MGLNFRKSISLGKNFKLNIGSKSSSISAGVKGARYSISTNGTRRATFGIPGTGLSYTKTFGTKKDKKAGDDKKKAKEIEKEIKKNTEAVEEYNESLNEVIGIHRDGVDVVDWNRDSTIPRGCDSLKAGVLAGDIDSYYEVINKVEPFDALVDFGSEFEIGTDNPSYICAEFNIKSDDVIPENKVEMTESGKLVEKPLTKSGYYEIFQDYVCSVTIRLARDLFALLPVEKVIVHAVDYALNTATGNKEEVTYLSVAFDRATFEKLNLDAIDPSDSLVNFEHNMKFAKTTGFKPVTQIENW